MVGDGQSDVEFGRNAGTKTVFIGEDNDSADDSVASLYRFSQAFQS
jgi:phosphoglycolate phosphatase-like HAD superfamily hydrolase